MAVATPVLEKNLITEEKSVRAAAYFKSLSAEDEIHNAKIRDNYAKLINPDAKIGDLIEREMPVDVNAGRVEIPARSQTFEAAPAKPQVRLVENARATADIFRADSPVNAQAVSVSEEEENEDLRPTQTTIQYKTVGVDVSKNGKIENVAGSKKRALGKKEIIIIAAVAAVIVALFVLIIVNSALISNINHDLNNLQSSLTTVRGAYTGIKDELNNVIQNEYENVLNFANANGMVKP